MKPFPRCMALASVACAGLLLAACARTPLPAWTAVDEAALDEAGRLQLARAQAARDAMFGQLVGALGRQLAVAGPAGAITVCRDEAPAIAADVGREHGLRIGRTSWRLRNPASLAPAWAEPLLASRPEEPRYARSTAGVLGVTLPIRVSSPCLPCHGPELDLAEDVRQALAAHYPEDQATGFASGDLRGWFWIEVPPQAR